MKGRYLPFERRLSSRLPSRVQFHLVRTSSAVGEKKVSVLDQQTKRRISRGKAGNGPIPIHQIPRRKKKEGWSGGERARREEKKTVILVRSGGGKKERKRLSRITFELRGKIEEKEGAN